MPTSPPPPPVETMEPNRVRSLHTIRVNTSGTQVQGFSTATYLTDELQSHVLWPMHLHSSFTTIVLLVQHGRLIYVISELIDINEGVR